MRFAPLAVAMALFAVPAMGQRATIDEGVFALFVRGERVGTEQFAIRQIPEAGGFRIQAQGTTTTGARKLTQVLVADTSGLPVRYEFESRDNGALEQRVWGDFVGRRFNAHATTGSGAIEREMLLAPGTVVLDEGVVHHLFFVVRRSRGPRVPVVVPRRLTRDSVLVASRGEGPVDLSNGSAPSRHLTVTDAAGTTTDVWVDAAGRLLRVEIPARGFVAVRDEAPR